MVNLQSESGVATATGNGTTTANATLNQDAGIITTEALTTAALATCVLTLNSNQINPSSIISIELANGTNTQGDPSIGLVTPGNAVATIAIINRHATQALNGTLKVFFIVFN